MHAMETIAKGAATSVGNTKAEKLARDKRVATKDDTYAGTMLANEVLAHAKGDSNVWLKFALRLIPMTIEARTAFIGAIKADKSAMSKANAEIYSDAKGAKKIVATATARISNLSTIAKAFNAGATIEGWMHHANAKLKAENRTTEPDDMVVHGSFHTLYLYCAELVAAEGRGRPADTWLTKLGKFLERNKPADDDVVGIQSYDNITRLYNQCVEGANKGK